MFNVEIALCLFTAVINKPLKDGGLVIVHETFSLWKRVSIVQNLKVRNEHYSSSNSIDPTDHSQSEKGH